MRAGVRVVVLCSASLLVVLPPVLYESCLSSGRPGLCLLAMALLTLPTVRQTARQAGTSRGTSENPQKV